VFCSHCGHDQGSAARCPSCGTSTPAAKDRDAQWQLPYSGWWQRVGASIIDSMVVAVPVSVVTPRSLPLLTRFLIEMLLLVAYNVHFLSSTQGQTLGNRAVRTRVVDARGRERLSIAQAAARPVVMQIPGMALLLSAHRPLSVVTNWAQHIPAKSQSISLPPSVSHTITQFLGVAVICLVISLLDVLWSLWSPRRQTLHDKIVGSLVVKLSTP